MPADGEDDAVGGVIEIVGVIHGILVGIELHTLPAVLIRRLHDEIFSSVAQSSGDVLRPPEALEIGILAM